MILFGLNLDMSVERWFGMNYRLRNLALTVKLISYPGR